MRPHAETHTVEREVEPALPIGADGTDGTDRDVTVRTRWPADDVTVEARNLGGVQLPLNDHLARGSHGVRP